MKIGKKHKIEKYSQIIANTSQIVLVIVAIFGYFYTIVPAYENKKLTEENEKIRKENIEIKNYSEILKNNFDKQINEYAQKLKEKEEEYAKQLEQIKKLAENRDNLEREIQEKIKEETKVVRSINLSMNKTIFKINLSNLTKSRYDIITEISENSPTSRETLMSLTEESLDKYLASIFINSAVYVEEGLKSFIIKYGNEYYNNSELYIKIAKKCLNYLLVIKQKYDIQNEDLVNIRTYLRWYIHERNNLNKKISEESDVVKKLELKFALSNLYVNAYRDIGDLSKVFIDSDQVIDEIVNKVFQEYQDEIDKN